MKSETDAWQNNRMGDMLVLAIPFLLIAPAEGWTANQVEDWLPDEIEAARTLYIERSRTSELDDQEILFDWLRSQRALINVELARNRPEIDATQALAAGDQRLAIYQHHYFTATIVGVACSTEFEPASGLIRLAFWWGHTELGLERSEPLAEAQFDYIRRYNHVLINDPGHPAYASCGPVETVETSQIYDELRHAEAELEELISGN